MNSHPARRAESRSLTEATWSDAELMDVVAKFFSHLVGVRSGARGDQITWVRNILVMYAGHGVADGHGGVTPPPHPDLPKRFRAGDTALHALGLTPEDLRREWERRKLDMGVGACFDLELLTALIPLPLWRVAATLLRDGPEVAIERFERGLASKALERKPPSERRAGDRLSRSYVAKFHAKVGNFFTTLREMNVRGVAPGILDDWSLVPRIPMPEVPRHEMDMSGPPLRKVRRYRASLNRTIEDILRPEAHGGEIAAIRAMPTWKLNSSPIWRPMRDRVIVGILMTIGCRPGALVALRRSDFRSAHQSPDGRIGPALVLRPGKTKHPSEVAVKPIPVGLAIELDSYLALLERLVTEGSGSRPARQMPDDPPLLVMRPSRVESHIQLGPLRTRFGGSRPGPNSLPIRPEIARYEDADPTDPRSFVGYSPLTFRHTAEQSTREATRILNRRLGEDLSEQAYTGALQDREIHCDPYGYGDLDNPRKREVLAGRAAEVNWELLTTDLGLRRRPDVERFESNLRRLRALEAEIARLREDADRVFAETRAKGGTIHLKLDALLATQEAFHRVQELNDDRMSVQKLLLELRADPESFAGVPDEEATVEEVDLDEVERRILGGVRARAAERIWRPPVRWFLTVPEFAEVFGLPYSSAHRWIFKKTPFPAGDPRNPWQPTAVPFDRSRGKRRGRIVVAGINPAILRTQSQRDRLLEALTRPPEGWRREDWEAPLRLPGEIIVETDATKILERLGLGPDESSAALRVARDEAEVSKRTASLATGGGGRG